MATVIVPRDCIIEGGTRYCESHPISPDAIGLFILTILVAAGYIWLLSWLYIEREVKGVVVFGVGVALPIAAFALFLIFGVSS